MMHMVNWLTHSHFNLFPPRVTSSRELKSEITTYPATLVARGSYMTQEMCDRIFCKTFSFIERYLKKKSSYC